MRLQAAAVPSHVRGLLHCSAGLGSVAASPYGPAGLSFVLLMSHAGAQAGLVAQKALVLSRCCLMQAL